MPHTQHSESDIESDFEIGTVFRLNADDMNRLYICNSPDGRVTVLTPEEMREYLIQVNFGGKKAWEGLWYAVIYGDSSNGRNNPPMRNIQQFAKVREVEKTWVIGNRRFKEIVGLEIAIKVAAKSASHYTIPSPNADEAPDADEE